MDYREKLQDIRWRQKRSQILFRDNYSCQKCGNSFKSLKYLHVHHKKYIKVKEPWEYQDEYLITLCDFCHSKEYSDMSKIFLDMVYAIAQAKSMSKDSNKRSTQKNLHSYYYFLNLKSEDFCEEE